VRNHQLNIFGMPRPNEALDVFWSSSGIISSHSGGRKPRLSFATQGVSAGDQKESEGMTRGHVDMPVQLPFLYLGKNDATL